jgi:hypothetical protein
MHPLLRRLRSAQPNASIQAAGLLVGLAGGRLVDGLGLFVIPQTSIVIVIIAPLSAAATLRLQ